MALRLFFDTYRGKQFQPQLSRMFMSKLGFRRLQTLQPPTPNYHEGLMKRYTTLEVAEMWGVSDKHVRRLIKQGSLKPVDLGAGKGRVLRITEEELLRFEASRTVQPKKIPSAPLGKVTQYY